MSAPPLAATEGAGARSGARIWAARLIRWTLTLLVTWFILSRVGVGLDELGAIDWTAWRPRPWPLAGSIAVLLAGYAFSAALWGVMVAELGGPELPPARAVRVFMVANLGRYVPGKVWQIAGLAVLGRRHGVPPALGATAALLGQAIALVAATALGLGAFLTSSDAGLRRYGEFGVIVVTAAAVLVAVPASLHGLARAGFRLLGRPAPARVVGRSTFGLRWLVLYALNWLLYAAAFWLLFRSFFGAEPFLRVGGAFAAAYVAGYLALFAPAGVGVREGFLVALLAPVTGPEGATVLAAVQRVWITLVEVLPAGVFAWIEARRAAPPEPPGEPPAAGPTVRADTDAANESTHE